MDPVDNRFSPAASDGPDGDASPPVASGGSRAAAIVFGLMSLVYALGCGCVLGGSSQLLGPDGADLLAQLQTQGKDGDSLAEQFEAAAREEADPEKRRLLEELAARSRSGELGKLLAEGLDVLSSTPSGERLRTATMGGVIAQLLLALAGALLLGGAKAARLTTLFAAVLTLVFVGWTILLARGTLGETQAIQEQQMLEAGFDPVTVDEERSRRDRAMSDAEPTAWGFVVFALGFPAALLFLAAFTRLFEPEVPGYGVRA